MSLLQSYPAVPALLPAETNLSAPWPSVDALVAVDRPEQPLHCLRPAVFAGAAEAFTRGFPGSSLYAVKCNPDPAVLRWLWAGGISRFDCASIDEISLVRGLFPEAGIHFMHPVKARGAIRSAWNSHGVRDFVLDSPEELAKIRHETQADPASGLGLFVRLALPKGNAMLDLSGKFGALPRDAADLLRHARPHAARLGICFHVGSQMLEPQAWRRALALASSVMRDSGVTVDVIDVGGGFPVAYPGVTPPPLSAFFGEITRACADLGLGGAELWAEPGRALVAAGGSVILQVQGRRGRELFVNDGVFGALSDAGAPGFTFPTRLVRPDAPASTAPVEAFALFGPTCDSADRMEGPFWLPGDVREGDWIEVGQLGAYGACLRTSFNGFGGGRVAVVKDPPMLGERVPSLAAA